jgi:uncharacterized membrane protein
MKPYEELPLTEIPVHHSRRCTGVRVTSTWNVGWAIIIHILLASLSLHDGCQAFAPKARPLLFLQSKIQYNDFHIAHILLENTNIIRKSHPTAKSSFRKSILSTKLNTFENDFQWNATGMRHQRQRIWSPNLSTIRQNFRKIKQQIQSKGAIARSWTKDFQLGKLFPMHHIRRTIFMLSFALMISFHAFFPNVVNAAVSGGRMGGGSFKQSSSASSGRVSTLSRPSLSTPRSGIYTSPSILPQRTPIIINSFSGSRGWYAPTHESALIMSRVSTKDIILVTGTGMLLAYGFRNNRLRGNGDDTDSLLGSGYTVGSMTVSIDVPDRSSTDNILHKLNLLAMSADTMTKRGLQDLLSSVTLELIRQEKSITSAYTQSKSYSIMGQAEREFQVLSVASQSKVDRLTGTFPFFVKGKHCQAHFHSLIFVVSPNF